MQLAAIYDDNTFNRYILPEGNIEPGAGRVTQLQKKNNNLYHKGKYVETVYIMQCLLEFCAFLSSLDKPVLLYGHNARVFDCPLLVAALSRYHLIDCFSEIVTGFADTLRAFKVVLPEQKSHKLGTLVENVMEKRFEAHDAMEDARALQELCKAVADVETVRQHSFHIAYTQRQLSIRVKIASLRGMIKDGAVTEYMARKIANSGLAQSHLVRQFNTGGDKGVVQLLKATCNGKPRVTTNERVLRSIVAYLKEKNKDTHSPVSNDQAPK